MNTKIITEYLHSDKESMWEAGAELGLDFDKRDEFKYALYEVAIGLEVDMDTGKSRIVSVNGVELKTLGEFR